MTTPPLTPVAKGSTCARCGDTVSDRTPPEGFTVQVGLQATITTTTWKLRLRRFRWTWLPKDARDRVNETYTTFDLCDWCAGDVFLFAQGLPPRDRPVTASRTDSASPAPVSGGRSPKPAPDGGANVDGGDGDAHHEQRI